MRKRPISRHSIGRAGGSDGREAYAAGARSPAAGGPFAFADPDARLGSAYLMNQLDFYLEYDPRGKALRDAVDRAIARHARASPV